MRRSMLALIVALLMVGPAQAQGSVPNGVFVRNSEGFLWLVLDGQRVKIPVWPASDEEIAALPVPDRWAVMNESGAIVAGDRPAWLDVQPAPAAPAPPAAPPPASSAGAQVLTFQGARDRNTDPFTLSGGNYKVRWTATPRNEPTAGCFHSVNLEPVQQGGRSFSAGTGSPEGGRAVSTDTNAFNVPSGMYYFRVISGCAQWTVSIEPLR